MSFKYIKKSDKTKELFYKIPKQLMLEAKYKKMKDSAKILYSILYERTDLSIKNDWFDKEDNAYIICTYDEIQVYFGASRSKVTSALKDLENFDLIKKSKILDKHGESVHVLYVAHVDTTEDTLQVLMNKHKEDYHNLRDKKREYKREYDKKQAALKKAKREAKLSKSENQTTVGNTTIPRVKFVKPSNFNSSPKIRLRVVRKSDYRNTNKSNTDNISMYVCNEEQQTNSFLDLYKRYLVPSTYVESTLTNIENQAQITYELLEAIIIKALNNKRISDYEKWIIKTINNQIKKGVKTLEEYEDSVKEFNKKYTKSKINTKGSSKSKFHNFEDKTLDEHTPETLKDAINESQTKKYGNQKLKTRYHNINQTFKKYEDNELEKLLQDSQRDKFRNEDITPNTKKDYIDLAIKEL